MLDKLAFGLSMLLLVIFLGACVQQQDSSLQTTPALVIPTQSPLPEMTSTPQIVSCGVGLIDHNVDIWIEGQYAQAACSKLILAIRQQGSQPTNWDGQLSSNASSYQPVCSDAMPELQYEVVDTGGQSYGTTWCRWMVSVYGGSGSVTDPDLFGIVRVAQDSENTEAHRQQAEFQATVSAMQLAYVEACKLHHGYIDTNGFGTCRVDYPGSPRQEVAINTDGTWDAAMAEFNRVFCEQAIEYATSAAQAGQPQSNLPVYHPDTGVCVLGN